MSIIDYALSMRFKRAKPKWILFDADGTLYDSTHIMFATYKKALGKYSNKLDWATFKQKTLNGSKSVPSLMRGYGIEIDVSTFYEHHREAYKKAVERGLSANSHLLDFLRWCQQNSIHCAIVSASRRYNIDESLDVLKITKYFEFIISKEDANTYRKPHPHPYNLALKRAGISATEALAIEDSMKGVAAAKQAGITCIAIHHKYNSYSELAMADRIVQDFNQIKIFLD